MVATAETKDRANTAELRGKEEAFLNQLYDRIVAWARELGMEEVSAHTKQDVLDWGTVVGRTLASVGVSFELKDGVVFRHEKLLFGVAKGRGLRYAGDQERPLRVMFGGSKATLEGTGVNDLKFLVRNDPRGADYLYGEFAQDHRKGIVDVDCWADDQAYGGRGISGLSRWNAERLYSDEGIRACLEVVQRTMRNG